MSSRDSFSYRASQRTEGSRDAAIYKASSRNRDPAAKTHSSSVGRRHVSPVFSESQIAYAVASRQLICTAGMSGAELSKEGCAYATAIGDTVVIVLRRDLLLHDLKRRSAIDRD